jgi:hypothetical protein
MNVGGQIRFCCCEGQIIKQMLELFSFLNFVLLASSQPFASTQNDT